MSLNGIFRVYLPRRPDFAEVAFGFPLGFGVGFDLREKSGIAPGPLPFLPRDGLTWMDGRAACGMVGQ
jgi:hypothetical protein